MVMSGSKSLLALVVAAVCGTGCASENDPSGDPLLPTGPPPEMTAPPTATTGGGADAAAAEDTGAVASTTGAGPAPVDSGVDAGSDSEVDSGTPAAPDDGPLNMAPVSFGPNIKVSDGPGRGQQTEVVMASHEELIFVGWMDNRAYPTRCAYSVSRDGGESWSKAVFASTQGSARGAFAGDPAVAIDDAGNLYAGCQDYASGGLGENFVLLAHSRDAGATWSEFKRVNQSLDKPWLGAAHDGTVLLSWLGGTWGAPPAGIKRSTDYGATWSEPVSLGSINHGTILAIGNTGLVHVAYNTRETTVTYRRSDDYGVSFDPARDLSSQGTPCRSPCAPRSHPIVGGGTDPTGQVVAITWASTQPHPDAEGDDDVWVIVSYDAGESFSEPIRVNDNASPSRQLQPWAAVDRYGAVHVVWTDLRDSGQNATYYARMVDPAAGFESNVEVTDATGGASSFLGDYKGIAIQGRDVIVTWTDTRSDSGDIYFARAEDAAAAGGPLLQ